MSGGQAVNAEQLFVTFVQRRAGWKGSCFEHLLFRCLDTENQGKY